MERIHRLLRVALSSSVDGPERALLFGHHVIKLAILLRMDQSPHPCANNHRQRRGTGQQLRQRSTGSGYGEAPIYNAEHSAREESGEMCEHIGVLSSGTDERKQGDGGDQWRPAVGPACSACGAETP